LRLLVAGFLKLVTGFWSLVSGYWFNDVFQRKGVEVCFFFLLSADPACQRSRKAGKQKAIAVQEKML
jgi:hypothetical protein